MNVVAITVTYNRADTLSKNIDALLKQIKSIDKIVIVDNNSNTHHKNLIKEIIKKDINKIDYIELDDNLGGAGGFEAGMRYAKEKYDPDWYWIMDDDAYPRKYCLKKLLEFSYLDNIGCLCPVAFGIDLNQYQVYHHKKISKNLITDITFQNDFNKLDLYEKIDANAFVGPLISKKAIDKVGFADGSLFIYGDDTEYTFRVNKYFNNYLIKEAVIDHQDQPITNTITHPNFWWKEYYCYRNRYFFISEFSNNIFKSIISKIKYTLILLKSIFAALIKPGYKHYRLLRISILIKAINDGLFNKKGKIIDPKDYLSKLKGG